MITAVAQRTAYTAFTVNEGLPSNHVYQCVEDNDGFLWIATDEGVARFDGKYFQVFTTANGLPDNEVLQIVKEKSGRIWVNCFKQSPAYFDVQKNRFINASENPDLAFATGTVNMNLFALPDDGVHFSNEKGSFVFRNATLDTIHSILGKPYFRLSAAKNNSLIAFGGTSNTRRSTFLFYLIYNNVIVDSVSYQRLTDYKFGLTLSDNKLFDFYSSKGTCFIYTVKSEQPLVVKQDSIQIAEPFSSYGVNDTTIYFTGVSGTIYVHHKSTYKFLYALGGDFLANRLYEDSQGNRWICSVDKGLLLYRKNAFSKLTIPANYTNTNFLSIAKNGTTVLAGNYYGEIIEFNQLQFKVHTLVKSKPSRQRKIIFAGKDVYSISEDGVFLNFKTSFVSPENKVRLVGKTALLYNDTTLLIGSVVGVYHLNTRTNKITHSVRYKRGMSLAKGLDGLVYYGSTDGLYRYNVQQRSFESLIKLHPCFNDRIVSITVTADSIIWIATASNGLAVLYQDKVIGILKASDGLISNTFRTVTTGKTRQIWLGTAQGISVIQYQKNNYRLIYTIQNISVNNGLTSNEVNEMLYYYDTVYAATSNGISLIPTHLTVAKNDIPVRLIKMSINELDTLIRATYDLSYATQNIQMQFAAISLTGLFKKLQYRLGNQLNWLDLNGNILTLKLNSGNHLLQVRAVDVNGYASKSITTIQFHIATPFWKSVWFWLVVAVLIQIVCFFAISNWQKTRKEQQLAKKIATVQTAALEQQAFTLLMNPHFMFNALNSIQHYINVQDRKNANRYLTDFASLLRKSFEAAQQYFIPLEEELENIKIYLRLEQMRFADRFTYTIHIAENVELENWMIPTMMLQPLLENALLHGIMPSTIQGEIAIKIKEENTNLVIAIIDNGIGIAKSQILQEHSSHNSHGTDLIHKRIVALNQFGAAAIQMHTKTAFADEFNPGVKTVLHISSDLYSAWIKANQA
jgi:ligand-binding sensor domain-containing protein/signal transduction histidine kinase